MSLQMILRCVLGLFLLQANSIAAQTVTIRFSRGHVSLSAVNARLEAILSEWGRIGNTRIVNGERVSGEPVTLELIDVPESQALDLALRSAGGYIATRRRIADPETSAFNVIVIFPKSAPPTPPSITAPPELKAEPPSLFDLIRSLGNPQSEQPEVLAPDRSPVSPERTATTPAKERTEERSIDDGDPPAADRATDSVPADD
jgi:hypothetical protein